MSLASLPMGSPASSLGLWLNTTNSIPVGAGGAPGYTLLCVVVVGRPQGGYLLIGSLEGGRRHQ